MRPQDLIRRHVARRLAAAARNGRGAVAVEFALLAIPFFIVLFGILETFYLFLVAIVLEGATADGARQIRTGVVQQSGDPLTTLRTLVCDNMVSLVACGDLIFDVRNFSAFADVTTPEIPADQASAAFAPGQPGDIVIVRVSYNWTFMTPFIETLVSGGDRAMVASAAFRNEPYLGALE